MLGLFESMAAGSRRRRAARTLMQMDDYLLADIGLTRGDVAALSGTVARPNLSARARHE